MNTGSGIHSGKQPVVRVEDRSQDRRHRLCEPGFVLMVCLLGTLVALAYAPTLWSGYIWDDDAYVTGNAVLRDWGGLWRIWFDPSATPQYYPLVHTGFWI